ncbi:carboxylating nicotinate-nucleotide diphosphorylase [Candidatus Acetothermia bacterium]|nr:carboxylating nicotinate-nucleotide diphosphorylase [Candidatus Acetothermia bacterium]
MESYQITEVVRRALREDLSLGDVTTTGLIPRDLRGCGTIIANEEGLLAGIDVACEVFRQIDPVLTFQPHLSDGTHLTPKTLIATVKGRLCSILSSERVALNFLQHLSGIATLTAQYVAAVADTKACILDTRKTIPGLRHLAKYAVAVGGGKNHRICLGDGVLIKENHIIACNKLGMELPEIIKQMKRKAPHTLRVEIEVRTVTEAGKAAAAGADIILLDNMSLEEMEEAVTVVAERALLEASGGITRENIRAVAETGVDLISIGALTHSAKALDISLDVN